MLQEKNHGIICIPDSGYYYSKTSETDEKCILANAKTGPSLHDSPDTGILCDRCHHCRAVCTFYYQQNTGIKQIAGIYIWVFRGTPLLVQLFIMYWGICNPLGINKWIACISALSLNVGAYSAETIRAAILSINKGQWEAGYSLGMSYQQTFRRIIIPQAATVSIPPLFNTFIGLVKDTSLASTIMIGEMFRKAQEAAASSLEYLWIYIEVALIYLLFCTLLTGLQKWIEKKLRVGK